jgi:hypothetical protein
VVTYAVVAIWVEFTVAAAVGAVGVPARAAFVVFALSAIAELAAATEELTVVIAPVTNAVVASWVVFVPAVAVGANMFPQMSTLPLNDASPDVNLGAVTVPVNVGPAKFAFKFRETSTCEKLGFKFKEVSTCEKLGFKFRETSTWENEGFKFKETSTCEKLGFKFKETSTCEKLGFKFRETSTCAK